ncbi:MAG: tetratricopeptide repeat protein [Candidatus Hodarchaeota archaeon]
MTEINCKICDEKINFDPNNPKTYINKSESGNPMIGKLFSIRVGHQAAANSLHVNVVVVDEKGEYRAHKDYYEEKQSIEGAPNQWNQLQRFIPLELRIYLSLASIEEKNILSSLSEPFNKTPKEWYECLTDLWKKNPDSQLITFLAVKWGFIIGKGKELINYTYKHNSWSYLLYIRLQARFAPSSELIQIARRIDFKSAPIIIRLEEAIAKSEVFLRLSAYDLLEKLYDNCQKEWGDQTSIEVKTGLMILQGYYGFRLYFLGRINEAIDIIEPVFNFGQILGNREIIMVTGNFYAAVNQSSGDLEKALKIFEIVLKVSEEMGDERTNAVISSNMSVIESKQGLYDQALKRQQTILELPIVKEEFFIRSSLMSIIAETLFISERYDESEDLCKKVLSEENIPTYYKLDLLSTLKRIAGKTDSLELLDFVRNNLPTDSDFLESPVGYIFMHDLQAIEGELNNNWLELIVHLKEEREIMFKNRSVEDASDIEIRLAEGYFRYFLESGNLEHLNHAYNHLDLAKTIAIENQSYIDLCRLVLLKGLLAAESKLPEQAKIYFEEALKTAQEYSLSNLEKEINENLEQLNTGIIEKSAGSILRRMFNRLTFRKTEEKQSKKKSVVYTMFIGTQDSAWELLLLNEKNGSIKDVNYLLGFHDLWNNVRKTMIQQQINYFTVSRGAVLIENSSHFQLFALCDQLDYLTRLTIQNLLPELEDFAFRHIPEELEEKVLKTLSKDIGKFTKLEIH